MRIPIRLRSSRFAAALVALLALTACDLYPDAGKWTAVLTVHDASWTERYTCSVDIDITHTEEAVSLNSVDSYCGERSLHWSPSALERRGTELWLEEQHVGDIFPDGTVKIELPDPENADHYPNRVDRLEISWTRLGEELQFSLTEVQEGKALTMEGSMHRVQ